MNNNQKQGKSKTSQTKTVKTSTQDVKVSKQPAQKPKQKQNPPRKREGPGPAKALVDTLNDPFQHPGAPLGFGTMVSTKTATAVYRIKTITNATDGAMTIFGFPNADCLGATQSQTTNASPVFANYAQLLDPSAASARAVFSAGRPISYGIRVTPISSNNDKAVRVSAGLVSYTTLNQVSSTDERVGLMGVATATWFNSRELTNMILPSGGSESCQVVWRPQDLENYNFTRDFMGFNTVGNTVVLPPAGPICVIAILGPNAMEYQIDIVCRYEALPSFGNVLASNADHEYLSKYYPSIERMWQSVSPHLTPNAFKTAASVAEIVYDAWSSGSITPYGNILRVKDEQKASDEKAQVRQSPPRSPSYFG